ncbi:RecQ family ATP-dependent DNA helicase [Aliamphritea hakodatensis]|uniref:RecQ family ATP-dependent DNA helicase n=1 Tax=Aliamphritea hakodatensis TaxID=2895352 RepID=UPI0022FD9015|nr:RecQ family ATP-dependent DNA helicase [Aliamphritea hakodatensis]
MDTQGALQQYFGFDQFRPGQQQTVDQLLQGHSSLAIFPTGSGKSLCYQLSALQLPHLTLVVSPLLALMKDQLEFLHSKGIPAARIDSGMSFEENRQVMADARSGKLKILMVSVERFKNERFRQFIAGIPLSMLVVDEAHCISEWGHNFRPDYLKLPVYRETLNIPLVLLLTATATEQVKVDMAAKFAIQPEHIVQTGFYRPNLDLSVWAVAEQQRHDRLLEALQQSPGAAVVYVTLQQTAEKVAEFLQHRGLNAAAYHAGFKDEQRQQVQDDFMAGRVQVVVATIAFGMGVDKSDIRCVVHYDLPKSVENYSQEIGRAGRDGAPSNCIALGNLDGINTVENFVYGDTPEPEGIRYVLQDIADNINPEGNWEVQLLGLSNSSNIRQLTLKTLLVQLELLDVIQAKSVYFAEFKYKFLQDQQEVLNRFNGERRAFLQAVFAHTQFKRVWGELDMQALLQSYGGDRDRAVKALEYLSEQQLIELQSRGVTEVFGVNQQALLQPELADELQQYFAEKEQKEIARIAALVGFFEENRCLSHQLAEYFADHQAPAQCGHCSVCRGEPATLSRSRQVNWPEDTQLAEWLQTLAGKLAANSQTNQVLTIPLACRFLAGISVPVWTKIKARQLPGYGSCEDMRYGETAERVQGIVAKIQIG